MSSNGGIAIREATLSDSRAIAEVHVTSWRWAYRDQLSGAFLEGLSVEERERAWIEWLAQQEPASQTLVAVDRDRIVGFCSFGPCHDDDAGERTAEVLTIYLLEDAAGRGIGRDLFAAVNDRLRSLGFARATLWVLASNERTRRFYEKAGWTWDGTVGEHRFDCANLPIVRYATDL